MVVKCFAFCLPCMVITLTAPLYKALIFRQSVRVYVIGSSSTIIWGVGKVRGVVWWMVRSPICHAVLFTNRSKCWGEEERLSNNIQDLKYRFRLTVFPNITKLPFWDLFKPYLLYIWRVPWIWGFGLYKA